ncbi:MAG: hypothetical protein C0434_04495 [Xanthomonadaceae bacterium]|nr:hypothetical protein [Xanthomonadaceae bacterium]
MTAETTITVHLTAYRSRALMLQTEHREAEAAYDASIRAYLRYLADEAAKAGYALSTDHGDGSEYSIHAESHAARQRAHDWLATLPDIWNWMP